MLLNRAILPYANIMADEQRYFDALTEPELQNMLPEHIKNHAIQLKPCLIEDGYGYLDWVQSMEDEELGDQ